MANNRNADQKCLVNEVFLSFWAHSKNGILTVEQFRSL